jgi:hypothetical protein
MIFRGRPGPRFAPLIAAPGRALRSNAGGMAEEAKFSAGISAAIPRPALLLKPKICIRKSIAN